MRLHVIADITVSPRYHHAELARAAACGGANIVQLRHKAPLSTAAYLHMAEQMKAALRGTSTQLIVNDRADVAHAVAAGVHLGAEDLPIDAARALLGATACIGATANDSRQAQTQACTPCTYLGVGPVFGTRHKANPAPTLGLGGLRAIAAAVPVPVIAIGGITAERIADVMDAGAYGVAVLGAVVLSTDPQGATAALRQALDAWLAAKRPTLVSPAQRVRASF